MRSIASTESSTIEVKRADGTGRRRNYFGRSGQIEPDAQAFLVELPYAGARVNPHFHDIDQFQVVVAGGGRIGKRPLGPITFQYADAYTPYGPIVAGDEGISFFTLRNIASGGHFSMPGSRHLMPCRAGRNIAARFELGAIDTQVRREILLGDQADGVGAVGLRIPAGQSAPGMVSDGGGQYYLVCAGALHEGERLLGANSVLRVEPGEPTPLLQAGPDGAEVLGLQFGRPSARPGSDPAELARRSPDSYVQKTERRD
ncbi:MAG: hypothetical protein KDK91_04880 [Gammaproteobacteria bacterium]|nr:hypothetical protein [Gammaproteobacteria bacterium]